MVAYGSVIKIKLLIPWSASLYAFKIKRKKKAAVDAAAWIPDGAKLYSACWAGNQYKQHQKNPYLCKILLPLP